MSNAACTGRARAGELKLMYSNAFVNSTQADFHITMATPSLLLVRQNVALIQTHTIGAQTKNIAIPFSAHLRECT